MGYSRLRYLKEENMKTRQQKVLWLAVLIFIPFLFTSCVNNEQPPLTEEPIVEMVVIPNVGKAGQIFGIYGNHFPVTLDLNFFLGPLDHSSSFHEIGKSKTDENGAFEFRFEMPASWPDSGETISIRDLVILAKNEDGSIQSEALFRFEFDQTREPVLSLEPDKGGPGDLIVLNGKDFPVGASLGVRIGHQSGDLDSAELAIVQVDNQGLFSATINLPEKWEDSGQLISKQELMIAMVEASNNRILAAATLDFEPSTNPGPDDDDGPTSICDDKLLSRNEPLGYVHVQYLNLRTGPGIIFQMVTTLPQCELLRLVGRNEDGAWLYVQLANDTSGWVYAQYLKTNKQIMDLPVEEEPERPDGSDNGNGSLRGVLVTIEGLQSEVVAWGMPPNDEVVVWLSGDNPSGRLQVGNGMTDARGNVSIIFIMPSNWSDGQPVTESIMYLTLRSQSGASISATLTYIRWLDEDDGTRNRID
jgi:hypothetical protein